MGEGAPPWSETQNWAVESESRMVGRACGKPEAMGIIVVQTPLAGGLVFADAGRNLRIVRALA